MSSAGVEPLVAGASGRPSVRGSEAAPISADRGMTGPCRVRSPRGVAVGRRSTGTPRTVATSAFRRTRDPWAVLVSEVMAQQTQAARAAEAWTRVHRAVPDAGGPCRRLARDGDPRLARPRLQPPGARAPARGDRDRRGPRRRASRTRSRRWSPCPGSGRTRRAPSSRSPSGGRSRRSTRTSAASSVGRSWPAPRRRARCRRRPTSSSRRSRRATGPTRSWTSARRSAARASRAATACPLRDHVPIRRGGASAPSATSRRAPAAARRRFESTTRWLRGRILDRLRDAADGVGRVRRRDRRARLAAVRDAARGAGRRGHDRARATATRPARASDARLPSRAVARNVTLTLHRHLSVDLLADADVARRSGAAREHGRRRWRTASARFGPWLRTRQPRLASRACSASRIATPPRPATIARHLGQTQLGDLRWRSPPPERGLLQRRRSLRRAADRATRRDRRVRPGARPRVAVGDHARTRSASRSGSVTR